MSKKIKRLSGVIRFETTGVLNYNKSGMITKARQDLLYGDGLRDGNFIVVKDEKIKNGNSNHMMAKTMAKHSLDDGRVESVDYTSDNCINHYLFKDVVYKQRAGARKDWHKLCGTPMGIMRGIAFLESKKSFARPKTVFIGKAISDEMLLNMEVGSTSAPRNSTNDEGKKDKNSTSFFTRETGPKRIQRSDIDIDLQNLSVFLLDNGCTHTMHTHVDHVEETLEELKAFFKSNGVKDVSNINDKSKVLLNGGSAFEANGFVLTKEQLLVVLKDLEDRLKNFFAINSHGKMRFLSFDKMEDQDGLDSGSKRNPLSDITEDEIEIVFEQVPREKANKTKAKASNKS